MNEVVIEDMPMDFMFMRQEKGETEVEIEVDFSRYNRI